VVMIRLPISKEFYDLELSLAPTFDQAMQAAADQCQIPYKSFQFMADSLTYKDGHHMQWSSTARFSSAIAHTLMQDELNP